MAEIQLNGVNYEIKSNLNLINLLKDLKISDRKVAVEINGSIVHRHKHRSTILKSGDKVEIVHFIGGG